LSWLRNFKLSKGKSRSGRLSEEFGDGGARDKAWAEELELLDSYEEGRRLSEEEKERRRGLATDLEASLL
jgi:hypothetical protein